MRLGRGGTPPSPSALSLRERGLDGCLRHSGESQNPAGAAAGRAAGDWFRGVRAASASPLTPALSPRRGAGPSPPSFRRKPESSRGGGGARGGQVVLRGKSSLGEPPHPRPLPQGEGAGPAPPSFRRKPESSRGGAGARGGQVVPRGKSSIGEPPHPRPLPRGEGAGPAPPSFRRKPESSRGGGGARGGQLVPRGKSSIGEPPHPRPLPRERGPDRRLRHSGESRNPAGAAAGRVAGKWFREVRAASASPLTPALSPRRGGRRGEPSILRVSSSGGVGGTAPHRAALAAPCSPGC